MLPITPQKTHAIQTALTGDWELAIQLNEEILRENPQDIETLNRLAFAYTVAGKVKEAKRTYQKVLDIDTFNPIALKNLKRLGGTLAPHKSSNIYPFDSDLFLEESGKTKIIALVNAAQPKLLKALQAGQLLSVCVKRSKVFILDSDNQYIGMLPDNTSSRLIKLIEGGNIYECYVKSVDDNDVTIFLREKKRAARFKNIPSFLSGEKIYKFTPKQKAYTSSSED